MPNWQIEYTNQAESDILSLDREVSRRIRAFFRERVALHPAPKQIAEPLAGRLRGFHRFRIGDYRAVCLIRDNKLIVLVLFVDHRSAVYKRRKLPDDLNPVDFEV